MLSTNKQKLLGLAGLIALTALLTAIARATPAGAGSEMYSVEKNGVSVVLVGIRHGSATMPPPPVMRALFERASLIMPEFDMTDPARRSTASNELRHGNALAAQQYLNAEELGIVHAAWVRKLNGKAAMTADTLGQMHACGISLFLLPSYAKPPPVSAPTRFPPWEFAFVSEAKARGKSIVELEPHGSLTVCGALPREHVRALLLDAAKLGFDDRGREEYFRKSALGKRSQESGNSQASYAHMLDAISFSEGYKAAFLAYMTIRNKAMAEVIEIEHAKLAAPASGFALVGALHFHGDTGLLALLTKKGFLIKRIST